MKKYRKCPALVICFLSINVRNVSRADLCCWSQQNTHHVVLKLSTVRDTSDFSSILISYFDRQCSERRTWGSSNVAGHCRKGEKSHWKRGQGRNRQYRMKMSQSKVVQNFKVGYFSHIQTDWSYNTKWLSYRLLVIYFSTNSLNDVKYLVNQIKSNSGNLLPICLQVNDSRDTISTLTAANASLTAEKRHMDTTLRGLQQELDDLIINVKNSEVGLPDMRLCTEFTNIINILFAP